MSKLLFRATSRCAQASQHPGNLAATEARPGPPHWCTDFCQDPSHAFLSPLMNCISGVALRREPLATEAPPGPPYRRNAFSHDLSHAFLSLLLNCGPPGLLS